MTKHDLKKRVKRFNNELVNAIYDEISELALLRLPVGFTQVYAGTLKHKLQWFVSVPIPVPDIFNYNIYWTMLEEANEVARLNKILDYYEENLIKTIRVSKEIKSKEVTNHTDELIELTEKVKEIGTIFAKSINREHHDIELYVKIKLTALIDVLDTIKKLKEEIQ